MQAFFFRKSEAFVGSVAKRTVLAGTTFDFRQGLRRVNPVIRNQPLQDASRGRGSLFNQRVDLFRVSASRKRQGNRSAPF
jgi:hypothetical protein